jgi:hypothetical protein
MAKTGILHLGNSKRRGTKMEHLRPLCPIIKSKIIKALRYETTINHISGYFCGAEGLSEDFLKPEEEEFGVGHPA